MRALERKPLFRSLTGNDLEAAHRLSSSFSWPHRLDDWRLFLDFGEGMAACDHEGSLIGTAMWWRYGPKVATLGMVIVSSTLQGQGIGKALMQVFLERADSRALMLNSTKAGLRLYESLGFQPVGTIRQQQGEFTAMEKAEGARPLVDGDREAVIALDAAAFGAERADLLDRLMRVGQGMVLGDRGGLKGFAIRRTFGRGQAIGPLVAANEEDAASLVSALAAPGFLRLDVPGDAIRLSERLSAAGLDWVSSVTTMVRGNWPDTSMIARRFALVSQALG